MTQREAIATFLIVLAATATAVSGVVIISNPVLGAALGAIGGTLGALLVALKMDPRSAFGGQPEKPAQVPPSPYDRVSVQPPANILPPVPPVDLDQDYHFSADLTKRHPGRFPKDCQWCLAGVN